MISPSPNLRFPASMQASRTVVAPKADVPANASCERSEQLRVPFFGVRNPSGSMKKWDLNGDFHGDFHGDLMEWETRNHHAING